MICGILVSFTITTTGESLSLPGGIIVASTAIAFESRGAETLSNYLGHSYSLRWTTHHFPMTQTTPQVQIHGSLLPKPQEQAFLKQSLQENPIRPQASIRHRLPNLSTKKSKMEVIQNHPMPLTTRSLHNSQMVQEEYLADQIWRTIFDSKAHR